MPTLILTPRHTPDAQALWRAATRLGWGVFRLPSWRVPEEARAIADPVPYVEALFAPMIAGFFGLRAVEPPDDWLCQIPEEYRRRAVHLTTLGAARAAAEAQFIKPPNDKSFRAGIYRGDELPAEFDSAMPVLVSEIVEWEAEFRFFVLDREILTFSLYARDGVPQRDNDFALSDAEGRSAAEFANRVIADRRVELRRAAVLDIGTIKGRGWAVVEQNAVWGAGIYGCDPARVLEALRYSYGEQ
ncbi:MAG: hypothetical protein AMXMBFR47_06450 [Planctomycetota bacterium]